MLEFGKEIREGNVPETVLPPRSAPGVGGLNATQIARRSLEIDERGVKALEDIRDIVRTAAESLAPVLLALGQGLAPAIAQATKDVRELGEKILAALEYSPLDTHED